MQSTILPIYLLIHSGSLILLNLMLALTIAACFCSKRFTFRVTLIAGAGLYLVVLTTYCLASVPLHWRYGDRQADIVVSRWSIPSEINEAKERIAVDERKLSMLTRGKKAFEPKEEPADGVGVFHDSRG